jgi:hypothetical protein
MAVTLSVGDEDDVQSMITQPLLLADDDEEEEQQRQQHADDDRMIIVLKKTSTYKNASKGREKTHSSAACNAQFVVLGALTGFLIQVVSLGAYALLLLHYNNNNKNNGDGESMTMNVNMDVMTWWSSSSSSTPHANSEDSNMDMLDWKNRMMNLNADWFIYSILSVLTQIDLVIYVLIWIAFTCTMTRNGMQFLRFQYQNPNLQRRGVFVLGVYFLVGIVLGAFAAWSMIDVYLGFPIPFLPIVATVGIDLVLCYMMVWCYDLGRVHTAGLSMETDDEEEDDEEDEEDACLCC